MSNDNELSTKLDTSAQPVIKEQRGAYLGPKVEPAEMTQQTLVNPNPEPTTGQQSGQSGDGNG